MEREGLTFRRDGHARRGTGMMALPVSARSAIPERRSQARVRHVLERQEKFDRQAAGPSSANGPPHVKSRGLIAARSHRRRRALAHSPHDHRCNRLQVYWADHLSATGAHVSTTAQQVLDHRLGAQLQLHRSPELLYRLLDAPLDVPAPWCRHARPSGSSGVTNRDPIRAVGAASRPDRAAARCG
jgi:hypothetical protein